MDRMNGFMSWSKYAVWLWNDLMSTFQSSRSLFEEISILAVITLPLEQVV